MSLLDCIQRVRKDAKSTLASARVLGESARIVTHEPVWENASIEGKRSLRGALVAFNSGSFGVVTTNNCVSSDGKKLTVRQGSGPAVEVPATGKSGLNALVKWVINPSTTARNTVLGPC